MPITPVKSGNGATTLGFYPVQNYGIFGDGTTDNTTNLANLIGSVNAAGGGILFYPPGTYITGKQLLYSHIHHRGSGADSTIIKLANGTNDDLFAGSINGYGGTMTNVNAANATGLAGGIYNFGFADISLDGNTANQSGTSIPLHYYGYGEYLSNLVVKNGLSGGFLSDWNGGSGTPGADAMEAFLNNVKVHDNGGIGFEWGGAHDSVGNGVFSFSNGSHCFHIGPNATGVLFSNSHGYQPPLSNNSVVWLIEANSGQYTNCVAEGSDTANIVMLAGDCVWSSTRTYGITGSTPRTSQVGIQLGQSAGGTPYNGSAYQSGGVATAKQTTGCQITGPFTLNNGGTVNFVNEANNSIDVQSYQTSGSRIIGTPNVTTAYKIIPTDTITADGTIGKGGGFVIPLNSPNAFSVNNRTSLIFNISSFSKLIQLSNGTIMRLYSDSFTTRVIDIGTNGTISVNQSATAVAIANNAAIVTAIGISRVAPTGNVTGCTLLNGSLTGQRLIVRNESAFTVLFAIAATSKIADADGTTNPIPANRSRTYEWSGSLWYQTN